MKLVPTSLAQTYVVETARFKDERGVFVKTFHEKTFRELGLETSFPEEYYSVSRKKVLRGLHFQVPPHQHTKLVYCVAGSVFDAVLDLREHSHTYGKYETFELDEDSANALYVPPGLAHGFYALSEKAIMLYKVSTAYSPEHDTGILWNSIDIPWPDTDPVISERDRQLAEFDKFVSPFK